MNSTKKIIIYDFKELFKILNEIKFELDYKIEELSPDKLNKLNLNIDEFYLILNKKKISSLKNQITLNSLPIKLSKLQEKINIEFLKKNFKNQSEIKVGKYIINLNSREMYLKDAKLRLTEKEINIILYLSKFDKSISIDKLQNEVWGYQSDLETHTVETHIYRLRKKIFTKFIDNNFIISDKKGYRID